ncbi:MAG: peptide chain release factor N(5)-glutamine methyltransferase [Treponema sp.]|jgi:release factor glutamine methyltransferase|nr:peptide chain release factor N(5)-glutamine methyltransferase [Treponema sp.]
MTIREATAQGAARLKAAGIETPSLDASLLLAHVLDTGREALAAKGEEELSQEAIAALRALLDRRTNGECIAYILEKKEFFGLEFLVNSHVLVPRPDTEILVEAALEIIKREEVADNETRILDLCTGSGAVAVSLKHEMPQIEVYVTDISAEALQTAKTNAARLLGENQIHFCLGDLYNAIPLSTASFNIIVSNPPYIPTDEIKTLSSEVQNEPRLALDGGKDGLEIIKRIIEKAPENLTQGGALLLEAAPYQMEEIAHLLENRGFKDIKLYKDLSGQKRVIGGRYEN